MTKTATTKREAEACVDLLERHGRRASREGRGDDGRELLQVGEVMHELIARLFRETPAAFIDETPQLDWDRIDAGDRHYLGRLLFRAFYERETNPDRFALLVGLATGHLCK